jgi:hypothetical protein
LRPTPLLLAALALAAGAASCGESRDPVPSTAVGVITTIEGEGSAVRSFTLETEDDGTFEVFIATDVDYGFDLAHLHEHETTGDPVRCRLEEREGEAYALEIVDA